MDVTLNFSHNRFDTFAELDRYLKWKLSIGVAKI